MRQKTIIFFHSTAILPFLFIAMPAHGQSISGLISAKTDLANIESNPTIVTITSEELYAVNTINLEQYLNTLPQVIPGFDATSNNPGNGAATFDLYGLGPERTLVLVNGHRFAAQSLGKKPSEPTAFFDLNMIPAALVKQVDIISGGQSALYGSGAVGGVVNLELNDEFEGSLIQASSEITEHGDGAKTNISGFFGKNFDNGNGNITLFANYTKRDDVFKSAREFSSELLRDERTGFGVLGSTAVPETHLFGSIDFSNAGYSTNRIVCTGSDGAVAEGLDVNFFGSATFDAGGELEPWINEGPNSSRYNYAAPSLLQLPQERINLSAFGRYNFNEFLDLKVSGIFTSNKVPQQLSPSPFFSSVTIDLINNPFLTPTTRSTISANIGEGSLYLDFVGRRMVEVGPRIIENDHKFIHFAAAVSGKFDELWSYEMHGHFANSNGEEHQLNQISIDAIQNAVLTNRCNIFGAGNFSQECADEVEINALTDINTQQVGLIGKIYGSFPALKSPKSSHPLQIKLGVEYRNERANVTPPVYAPRTYNTVFPNIGSEGEIREFSAFSDFNFPILDNQSYGKELSINGAYRIADHSSVGKMESYRIGAVWEPVSNIRFYTNLDRSVRPPSIGELFSSISIGFPGALDPCSNQGNGGPIASRESCITNGLPAQLYGTFFQNNGQFAALFGGNTNLKAELSDTIEVGFTAKSQIIDGLRVNVEYQSIDIDDAIGIPSQSDIVLGCYLDSRPDFCQRTARIPSGQLDVTDLTKFNFKSRNHEGVDVSVGYKLPLNGSSLDFKFYGSYAISAKYENRNEFREEFQCDFSASGACTAIDSRWVATDPTDDCSGFHQASYNVCEEPIPKWKHAATLSYETGPFQIMSRWRYIGSTTNDEALNQFARPVFPDRFVSKTGAQNYVDLTGKWSLNEQIELSGGILNIFDNDPPTLGNCCSEQANTFPATYDPLDRKFFIGAKARF